MATLFDPRYHARFLSARLKAVFGRGPAWRRLFSGAVLVAVFGFAPVDSIALWFTANVIGYHVSTALHFWGLHTWLQRPDGLKGNEVATSVTFARLFLPATHGLDEGSLVAKARVVVQLIAYALVRYTVVMGDNPQHVVHHLGDRRWTEAAYVLTRLLMEGRVPIQSTASVAGMFRLASQVAANPTPKPLYAMPEDQMLSM